MVLMLHTGARRKYVRTSNAANGVVRLRKGSVNCVGAGLRVPRMLGLYGSPMKGFWVMYSSFKVWLKDF